MSASAARHPSDEDRARDTEHVVADVAAALRGGDVGRLAGALRDDVSWADPEGVVTGPDAVARAMLASARGAASWRRPVQVGAGAVLGFERDGLPGALVLTVRRDGVVLAAGAAAQDRPS